MITFQFLFLQFSSIETLYLMMKNQMMMHYKHLQIKWIFKGMKEENKVSVHQRSETTVNPKVLSAINSDTSKMVEEANNGNEFLYMSKSSAMAMRLVME